MSCFCLKSFPANHLLQDKAQAPHLVREVLLEAWPCLVLWLQILLLPPPALEVQQWTRLVNRSPSKLDR